MSLRCAILATRTSSRPLLAHLGPQGRLVTLLAHAQHGEAVFEVLDPIHELRRPVGAEHDGGKPAVLRHVQRVRRAAVSVELSPQLRVEGPRLSRHETLYGDLYR